LCLGGKARFFSSEEDVSEDASDHVFDKIAVIGTGKMAHAMIDPMIRMGVQPADKIQIYDVSNRIMDELCDEFPGLTKSESLSGVVQNADLVLCAVKPQNLTQGFFEEVRKGMNMSTETGNPNSILLSIIAGKTIPVFEQGGFTKIVRSMPNTPGKITILSIA